MRFSHGSGRSSGCDGSPSLLSGAPGGCGCSRHNSTPGVLEIFHLETAPLPHPTQPVLRDPTTSSVGHRGFLRQQASSRWQCPCRPHTDRVQAALPYSGLAFRGPHRTLGPVGTALPLPKHNHKPGQGRAGGQSASAENRGGPCPPRRRADRRRTKGRVPTVTRWPSPGQLLLAGARNRWRKSPMLTDPSGLWLPEEAESERVRPPGGAVGGAGWGPLSLPTHGLLQNKHECDFHSLPVFHQSECPLGLSFSGQTRAQRAWPQVPSPQFQLPTIRSGTKI